MAQINIIGVGLNLVVGEVTVCHQILSRQHFNTCIVDPLLNSYVTNINQPLLNNTAYSTLSPNIIATNNSGCTVVE